MEIRWLSWLDDRDRLRLWRSWTAFGGLGAARAPLEGGAVDLEILVESTPERFGH